MRHVHRIILSSTIRSFRMSEIRSFGKFRAFRCTKCGRVFTKGIKRNDIVHSKAEALTVNPKNVGVY